MIFALPEVLFSGYLQYPLCPLKKFPLPTRGLLIMMADIWTSKYSAMKFFVRSKRDFGKTA